MVTTRVEEEKGCKVVLTIDVSPEDMKHEFDLVYEKFEKKARVPGFRKGKVPHSILESYFKEEARQEVFNKVIPEAYATALKEKHFSPAYLPVFDNITYTDKGLSFQATFDRNPTVTLTSYKGIKVKKDRVIVNEEDMSNKLDFLREQHAQFEAVNNRPLGDDGYAVVNYKVMLEDNHLVEKKEAAWMNKTGALPEIWKEMCGMALGETRKISFTIPENYHDAGVRQKQATFHIELKEIKEKHLPAADDEFARDIGEFKNLEELKEKLKESIKEFKEKQMRADMKTQIIEHLLKNNSFDLPESLIEATLKRILTRMEQQYSTHDKDKKPSLETPEVQSAARDDAVRKITLYYLLKELAEKEAITIEDKELDEAVAKAAQQANVTPAEMKKLLREKDRLEELREDLREAKVIDFLIAQAKVKTT